MKVALQMPNQLFEDTSRLEADKTLLVEHPRYFSDFDYHAKKLVLHRASMKAYAKGRDLEYVEHSEAGSRIREVFKEADEIALFDPVDHKLGGELEELSEEHDTRLELLQTPLFVNSMEWNREFFENHRYKQAPFYQEMRKRLDIMVDEDGKPEGGKWSFDSDNRKEAARRRRDSGGRDLQQRVRRGGPQVRTRGVQPHERNPG
nr:MAG: deoxyribodipyrimidine photo-lyase-related protein [Candidatus Nanosalinarum sp. J07AB56]